MKPIQKKLSIEGYKWKERKKELVEHIFENYSIDDEDCAVQDTDTKDVDAEDDATVTTTHTLAPEVEDVSTRGSPPHSISEEDSISPRDEERISPLYSDEPAKNRSYGLIRRVALASPHAGVAEQERVDDQVALEDGLEVSLAGQASKGVDTAVHQSDNRLFDIHERQQGPPSNGLDHGVALASPLINSIKDEDDCENNSVQAGPDYPEQAEANNASQSSIIQAIEVQVCGECVEGKVNSLKCSLR